MLLGSSAAAHTHTHTPTADMSASEAPSTKRQRMSVPSAAERFVDIRKILLRPSPFGGETGTLKHPLQHFYPGEYDFAPGEETFEFIQTAKILCIGAGGLGCELLKDLALMGFCDIHVIDMDTVDITNLNRQFLFRASDVEQGLYKSQAASNFVMRRVPGCEVTAHNCSIQEMLETDPNFYTQFALVIAGLDSVKARKWIDAHLCEDLAPLPNPAPESIIPLIDGGTEGFKGSVSIMVPHVNACYRERNPDLKDEEGSVPQCTLASHPRKPSHCVLYVMTGPAMKGVVPNPCCWAHHSPDRKYDTDSREDMMWIAEQSEARAAEYGITLPSAGNASGHADDSPWFFYTMGVVKNIIPAIASSNAHVSASCVHEAFKMLSFSSQVLDNFQFMSNSENVVCTPVSQEMDPDSKYNCLPSWSYTTPGGDTSAVTVATLRAGCVSNEFDPSCPCCLPPPPR